MDWCNGMQNTIVEVNAIRLSALQSYFQLSDNYELETIQLEITFRPYPLYLPPCMLNIYLLTTMSMILLIALEEKVLSLPSFSPPQQGTILSPRSGLVLKLYQTRSLGGGGMFSTITPLRLVTCKQVGWQYSYSSIKLKSYKLSTTHHELKGHLLARLLFEPL